jgi:hypothetical protein
MLNIFYFTTVCLTASKIGSLVDVQINKDPEGLRIFYCLVQVLILNPPNHYIVFYYLLCIVDLGANGIQIIIYVVEMTVIDTCSFVFLN